MIETLNKVEVATECFHCHEPCRADAIEFDDKKFCCSGCKAVYELFSEGELAEFYANRSFDQHEEKYDFLNDPILSAPFVTFRSDDYIRLKLKLPAIHCSSCVYVLENLHKADRGIKSVTTNFVKKEADILIQPNQISLSKLCQLLDSIGYKPDLSLDASKGTENKKISELSLQIGVAAFCFGNIMLLSFPEYLGIDSADSDFIKFFGLLSIALSIPTMIYAAKSYFINAFSGLRKGFFNIDIPIVLGILTLFFRSTYEIVFSIGPGYLDSLSGLIFFLLIGRWFQSKTYQSMSFERDYKSYFPLSVLKIVGDKENPISVNDISVKDQLVIRNEEIVPADAILLSDATSIDYSFVTGEGAPVEVKSGDLIYAGGRLKGNRITVKVRKECSQSYLTSLWNNQAFKEEKLTYAEELTNKISKHFTVVILSIALLGGIYWLFTNPDMMWQVVAATLIIACPCALALSAPFTNGNALRVFGKHSFYLKKAALAERLADIDTIVFDKTGTITSLKNMMASYNGADLAETSLQVIKSMTSNSTHPLSRAISEYLNYHDTVVLDEFEELAGKGMLAIYNGVSYYLGSPGWLGIKEDYTLNTSAVYFKKGDDVIGHFEIKHAYRKGVNKLLQELGKGKSLQLISGDNDKEMKYLESLFPKGSKFYFNQKPADKLNLIAELQRQGKKVMMIGDGLNDAGALKQSDFGIAITDDISNFSPACDAILTGNELNNIDRFLEYAKKSKQVIFGSFTLSFAYNLIGISLALSGMLTPIFAAILMPVSSISVVLFTTLRGNYLARKLML
ncbi:heavy metal translocating P-type ATPase [Fulvivirga lutimaris]|uniref:heavy metal translocating P-type ATPase n=1 Tax=Fulvivirga lutimaris TaxID=1819566 RepID=UPI0012BD3962|nr:heavy metal translocating P-type ATPase metal-binding domain-containing protein [Fulvivirga lutimaris]MTI40442.1 HAD family hydrolase [Fulvivirga lutimaris]